MKVGIRWIVLLYLLIAGCGQNEGPDSLSSRHPLEPVTLECVQCHSVPQGPRRQIFGNSGDFAENLSLLSHHVAGGADPTSDQCLVCHDQSTHTSGTVRLRQADSGASLAYDPANPTSLEPFCLSCHDTDGAAATFVGASSLDPFDDGRTLGVIPNVAGNKIDGYWNNTYTIHKNNGLTCAGSGNQATGCHGNSESINMHGSASKGLLSKNLTLPIVSGSPFNENDFKLCFDCHDNYAAVTKKVVLGYLLGGNYNVWWAPTPYDEPIRTLFRDRFVWNPVDYPAHWFGVNQPYNDNFFFDPYTPLHNYHMTSTDGNMQSNWNYRGNEVGRASCTTCHNVHGTSGTVRSTYDEFGIIAFTGLGPDEYKAFSNPLNYEDVVMKAYPINCNLNCHGPAGATSYWHTESDEVP